MFENMTTEKIRNDLLECFPSDIDKREGSIAYDAVAGIAVEMALLYKELEEAYLMTNIETATGEYLDRFASEHGLSRIRATPVKYLLNYQGDVDLFNLEEPAEFFDEDTRGIFGIEVYSEDPTKILLVCKETGTEYNSIKSGTIAVPVTNIDDLESAYFGSRIVTAIDDETDDSLRNRIKNKISGPAENGNAAQYKMWCESINGVGRATITPLKYGPNTVQAILLSTEGKPLTQDLIDYVQNYIDPMKPAYSVPIDNKGTLMKLGSGYGDGIAPLGAHFVAQSAKEFTISISVKAEIKKGIQQSTVSQEIVDAMREYFKDVALHSDTGRNISYAKIGSIIIELDNVIDYSSLYVNGGQTKITVPEGSVGVLGGVSLSVISS